LLSPFNQFSELLLAKLVEMLANRQKPYFGLQTCALFANSQPLQPLHFWLVELLLNDFMIEYNT